MKERRRSAERRAATPPKALKYERPDTASSIGSPRRHLMRDGEQGALSDLSYLRQQLRSERQQLEGELRAAGRASPEDRPSPAPRRRREKERPRSAVRVLMPPTPVEELNFQTLRDFHDLKYRVDSPSRAALRRLFPEPATDAAALELQQTTLLGEQQRKLHALHARLHGTGDLFPAAAAPFTVNAAERPPFSHPGLEPRAPFLSSLGDEFMVGDLADVPRARRVSFVDPSSSPPGTPPTAGSALRLLPDSFSLGSTSSSLNVERIQARNHERLRRLHGWDNDVAAGPGEASPLFIPGRHRPGSAISADSITSVATEPWLRPGSRGSLRLDLGVLSTGAGD
uniref:Centrosome and spindle pole associated protein 1-like n=1 Tax=Petromyzon marinus TaxID=7757 RepID=A0AAJ7T175_PETMA|nr:centrosome and spindle pole associated protein 1-like [Petromyzon marinus]